MNGAKIAIFTLNKIPNFIQKFLKKNKLENKVNHIALHQASKFVVEKITDRLNFKKKLS